MSATGTQSPPADNTTSSDPIGKSDKAGTTAHGVADSTQRQAQFGGGESDSHSTAGGNNMESAQKAALESISATEKKFDDTANKAQQF